LPGFDLKNAVTENRLVGLWRLMVGFRLTYLGAMVCVGGAALFATWTSFLLRYLVDDVLQQSSAVHLLPLVALGFVGLALAQGVFSFLGNKLAGLLGLNARLALIVLVGVPLVIGVTFFFQQKIARLYRDFRQQEARLTTTLQESLSGVRVVKAFGRQAFERAKFDRENWGQFLQWRRLALVVFATVPVLWLVSLWFRRRIIGSFRRVRQANSRITGSFSETIAGVRAVKALGREDENLQEFSGLAGEMYASSYRATWLSALFQPTVQLIGAVGVGAIAWYGGWQTQMSLLTIGSIQAFVSYALSLIWPMERLAGTYADAQHAIASAERVFSLLDRTPEIADRPGVVDPGTIRDDIVVDHVDFEYEAGNPVLQGFTLEVKQSEVVALVGPTGGGKSTIVNLLCRFYEPKAGAIRIGGRGHTSLSLHAIHSRIGMVLQTPYLFSGTIRENIRYGRLDATDEEVEEAAGLAEAHEFIVTLEKGYDTEVGEGGVLLSVGQKQLISLARAVLAQPEIFVMDEATSSVDTLTEASIQKGMEVLMKDRTSLIIAHRLSTVRRADRIVFIEDGQITEMGTHTELLHARGPYSRLYTAQFRQELEQKYGLLESPIPVV
jgi:ATP-binding cassette subfamily B protein